MKIDVTVDGVTLASVIREGYDGEGWSLGEEVASQIVNGIVADHDGYDSIRSRVRAVRDEQIREAIKGMLAEALNEPVTPTTEWGDKVGAETTLKALIVAEARKAFTLRADNYSANQQTVVGKLVTEAVREALGKEIVAEVKKARALVGDHIGQAVAAAVQEAMRVR